MKLNTWVVLGVILMAAISLSACSAPLIEEPTGIPAGGSDQTAEPTEPATAEPTQEASVEPGANDLAGTSWTLATINGSAPLAGTSVTLTFEEGQLGGTACNSYGGAYTASGGTIAVSEIASTLMACGEPQGVMEQEGAYLNLLRSAISYQLAGDHLTLGTADNPSALVFASGSGDAEAPPQGWATYQHAEAGFEVSFPDSGVAPNTNTVTNGDERSVRIDLPFAPDTNLLEKWLQIDVPAEGAECASPHAAGYDPSMLQQEQVTINERTWNRVSGNGAAAGNLYEFTAYTLVEGSKCVSLTFVLHSANIGNYENPPAEFDRAAESAVFEEIMSTFRWLP